jgi:hypothetical protein
MAESILVVGMILIFSTGVWFQGGFYVKLMPIYTLMKTIHSWWQQHDLLNVLVWDVLFNTLGTGYLNCLYAYKRKSVSPVLNVLKYTDFQ